MINIEVFQLTRKHKCACEISQRVHTWKLTVSYAALILHPAFKGPLFNQIGTNVKKGTTF